MRQRGSIFIVSLAVLAGLVMIAASVAATHELYMTAESNRLRTVDAHNGALGGVQYALEELYAAQQTSGQTTSTTSSTNTAGSTATTLQDDWAQLGESGDMSFTMGNTSFRMQIVDMASFININTAPEEQLDRLPLTQEQIDSLLDFRTAGETPRADGGKDEYYNGLTNPYNAKLATLSTFDELLQIKGFTPQTLYEPQNDVTNSQIATGGSDSQQPVLSDICTVYSYSGATGSTGQPLVNVAVQGNPGTKLQSLIQAGVSAAGAQVIANQTWTTLGQLLTQGGLSPADQKAVLNSCTTSATPRISGKINLNTATESVLMSIPNMTQDLADAIIAQQTTGFQQLGDLLDISGMAGQNLTMVDYFTVSSQTFLVRIVGESGGISYPLEAIVDIQSGMPKIIQMHRPPYSDYLDRWGWADTVSDQTDLTSQS